MNNIDDDLKLASDYVNECTKVHNMVTDIGLQKIDKSLFNEVDRRIDYLILQSNEILDKLEIDYKIAGWWKKRNIKRSWNNVGIWSSRIKVGRDILKYRLNNFEMYK